MIYSQDRMEGFLAAIALALFDTDRLRGTVVFHTVKVQMETGDLLEAVRRLDELRVADQLHVARYLEMVLLLADEGVVRVRKIETFVCVDAIVRNRPAYDGEGKKKNDQSINQSESASAMCELTFRSDSDRRVRATHSVGTVEI